MDTLKLWVIAFGLSGLMTLASVSQEAGGGVETPGKASVLVKSTGRLVPGQNFVFLLHFDRPPHGYVNARIQYKFQLTSSVGSKAHPEGNLQTPDQSTELIDDVPDYPLKLRVTRSMPPGTWKLKEVTIVGGIPHPIQVSDDVAFEVYEPTSPIRAKVIWSKFQRLEDGESFDFRVHFETTPEDYDPGEIRYRFQLKKPDQQEAPSGSVDHLSIVEGPMGSDGGQSTYRASVPVIQNAGRTDNRVMSLGEWKLVELSVAKRPVLLQDDVRFEVRAPNIILHVQAPSSVRAGGSFHFEVSVDGALKNPYCASTLSVDLRQRPREGHPSPNDLNLGTRSISLNPEEQQHAYEVSVPFAPDLPGGPWQGEFTVTNGLTNSMFNHAPPEICRHPNLEGDTRFPFNVEPAVGLVTPGSVTVTVNPSQVQLLRAEAERLTAKANLLKQQLSSEGTAANLALLQRNVNQEIRELDNTQAAYKKDGVGPSSERAVNVFFREIRFNYEQALKALSGNSARPRAAGPRLERVSTGLGDPSLFASGGSDVALGSFSYAATAYLVAASSATMTFNLDVESVPRGATVAYKQRTDLGFTPVGDVTNCQIPNLYRAGYSIRFQKPGFAERLYDFNGQTSTATKITVHLIPIGRSK